MLTWNPAEDVPVTCMHGGGVLLAKGLVRSLLAIGAVLESSAGIFFLQTWSDTFFNKPIRSSVSRTSLTLKFKIRFFPDEARF